ncbi:glycosyltransferase [Nocardia uniformis]|uniref:Glycosyltransferase n=1 Tax=Nocardia uniformis TaxID=53432 RepID=A0A849CGU2_9NOCA|nr:glycosyltransferase [Nocardia uniformis]NNH75947.1 glycosyltransferase [Nocardia uniformis]
MSDPRSVTRRPALVSVIIPVYNGLPDLAEQLEALARQDYVGDYEVLVSDNGSTDGLREYIARQPHSERLRLRYVDSSAKRGAPFARNHAAAVASGDFLVFVDQDDRVYPHWLGALVSAASGADAVGGPIESETLNDRGSVTWRPVPTVEEGFPTHWMPFANGNNTSYWRTAFEAIGGYDEDLINGGDDVDISWRLQQSGLTFAHTPDALVAYRLRRDFRGAWRQCVDYGYGYAQVCIKHRSLGCPRIPTRAMLISLVVATLCNPWNPFTRRRVPRGLWIMHAAGLVGRLKANLRYRTYTG